MVKKDGGIVSNNSSVDPEVPGFDIIIFHISTGVSKDTVSRSLKLNGEVLLIC